MKLPSLDTVPRIAGPTGHRVSLGVMENLVLTLMDGNNTICDIGDACGLEREMAQRIFKRLHDLNIVSLPGFETPAPGSPAPSSTPSPRSSGAAPPSAEKLSEADLAVAVDEFYEKVGKVNLYDLLGVPPTADRKAIRSAYFSLSKKFHPDRAFGKNLGAAQPRMERIFHELTRAYEVLSNAGQRAAYDQKIAPLIEEWKKVNETPQPVPPVRPVAPVKPDASPAAAAAPQPPVAPRAPVGRPAVRAAVSIEGPSAVPIRSSQQPGPAAAPQSDRPPGGSVRSSSIPAPRRSTIPPVTVDPTEAAQRREQWRRERLQKAFGTTAPAVGVTPGTKSPRADQRSTNALIDHARIALERQEFDEAIRSINSILSMEPAHAEAQTLLNKATEGKSRMKAGAIIKEGRLFQAKGSMSEAIRRYEQALSTDKDNVEARYLIASLLLELNQDFPRALTLTREILIKGGVKARYYALLGELMLKEHAPARAAEAFQKAINMDPDNADYRKRLKAIQGSQG